MSTESDRKAGRAELDRLNTASKKPDAAEPTKKKPRHNAATFGDLVGMGKKKERRVAGGETVMDTVDAAVKGAKSEY